MGKKEYTGLTHDGNLLKIARIRKVKNKWMLTQLDRIILKEETEKQDKSRSKEVVREYDEDFHFGIDQHFGESTQPTNGDLERLLEVDENGDHEAFHSNVMTLKTALEEINPKKVKVGLTIRTGDTDFQVLKDKNYSQLKRKEIQKYVEEHLKKVYGSVPNPDCYKYTIREDGSLLLASYQDRPYLLKLLENNRPLYSGKLQTLQMLPDESVLSTLIKKNYKLDEKEFTCIIHMGYNRSRIFFMKGNDILHTISPIDEGRGSSKVLDVIFSKILFQLDNGELPGLDRILITNNDLNGTSIKYFKKQFQDVKVEEFHFNPELIEIPDHLKAVAVFFTSAIGAALAAADLKDTDFNEYSMLPTEIRERQNVLQLRWHGVIVVLFMLVTPVVWNNMYQDKQSQIKELNEELYRTELSTQDLETVVTESNQIQQQLQVEQSKLNLLNNLGGGTYYWSRMLKTLNDGLDDMRNVWIDRIKYAEDSFILQGYSMDRSRIPMVTNLFKRAELAAVSVEEMREVKVYKFTIKVYYDFTDNWTANFQKIEYPVQKTAN